MYRYLVPLRKGSESSRVESSRVRHSCVFAFGLYRYLAQAGLGGISKKGRPPSAHRSERRQTHTVQVSCLHSEHSFKRGASQLHPPAVSYRCKCVLELPSGGWCSYSSIWAVAREAWLLSNCRAKSFSRSRGISTGFYGLVIYLSVCINPTIQLTLILPFHFVRT